MASGFSGPMVGMAVRGADAHQVGHVKAVHEHELLVGRRLQPTVHVPIDAVHDVTAGEVVLALTADDVDELYWVHAGEELEIDLHGIYKYDYVSP